MKKFKVTYKDEWEAKTEEECYEKVLSYLSECVEAEDLIAFEITEKHKEIIDIPCDFGTNEEEFKRYVGRKPKKGELESWVHYIRNGINAQLDWDIINTCAAAEFVLSVK